jgi:transcriptional regulator with XRE-family HTH domain
MKAEEIKEKRKNLGYTQKKLAELIGVSVQTINGYENGKEIPTTKYQILDTILNQKSSNIINEPGPIYDDLSGYNSEIQKVNEKIKEHETIITLTNNTSTITHHSEIIKLLKTQIELLQSAKKNHQNDK